MKKIKFRLLLATMTFLLCACDSSDDTDTSTNEPPNNTDARNLILPLGASRVSGNRPAHESYRFELWKELIENEWAFDFIGTMTDPASYPIVNNMDFDIDHQGVSGATSAQILVNLNSVLEQSGIPDIVLFSSPGGNDILQGVPYPNAITNINAIIDTLQEANPNITIIIEQIAPPNINQAGLQLLLTTVHQDILTIAAQQSTNTSSVIPVDMFTGFTTAMLADEIHYNQLGAEFIADRYFNVLTTVLEP